MVVGVGRVVARGGYQAISEAPTDKGRGGTTTHTHIHTYTNARARGYMVVALSGWCHTHARGYRIVALR